MRAFSVLLCAILVATASGWGWGGKKDADKVAWDFTDPEADHFGQAIEWDEAGKTDLSIKAFRACVEHTPSSEAWKNLATALFDADPEANKAEAMDCVDKALDMNPDNGEAMDLLRELDPSTIFVDLYTHESCKYCQELKARLKSKGLKFKNFPLDNQDQWNDVQQRAMGCCKKDILAMGKPEDLLVVMPQIFINNKWKGTWRSQADKDRIASEMAALGVSGFADEL